MYNENKAAKLIKFIKENYSEEDESSFFASINILKRHTKLKEVEYDSINDLMDMLRIIKCSGKRAMLIEIIVEILCFDFNSNQNILYEYIQLIVERETYNEEAAQCLSSFIRLGADKDEIFNEISKNLDKENAIKILLNVDAELGSCNVTSEKSKDFLKDLQKAKRIRDRSGVIISFLSIVHPQVMKYWSITPLFSYYLDKRTDLDFEWDKSESLKKLIESKVISIKEAGILKGLGEFTSNKIEVEVLNAKKLYDEFFGDDNPLDVIFTLPTL